MRSICGAALFFVLCPSSRGILCRGPGTLGIISPHLRSAISSCDESVELHQVVASRARLWLLACFEMEGVLALLASQYP